MRPLIIFTLSILFCISANAQAIIGGQVRLGNDDIFSLGIEIRTKNQFAFAIRFGDYSGAAKKISTSITKDFQFFGDSKPLIGIGLDHVFTFRSESSYDKGNVVYSNEFSPGEYLIPQIRISSNINHKLRSVGENEIIGKGMLYFYSGYSIALREIQVSVLGDKSDPDGLMDWRRKVGSKVVFGVGCTLYLNSKEIRKANKSARKGNSK